MDVLRWGRPPLALLLPVAMAKVLTNERLPEWLSELLDGQGTSLMALDASAWERLPHDEEFCERAAHYVLDFLVTAKVRGTACRPDFTAADTPSSIATLTARRGLQHRRLLLS